MVGVNDDLTQMVNYTDATDHVSLPVESMSLFHASGSSLNRMGDKRRLGVHDLCSHA